MVHEPTGKQTGIDVGLKAFYTDSDGQQVEHPRSLRQAEKKLKRLHRRVSKKQKGSRNRTKAIKRLAKGYLQVKRQRKDFACKAARALVQSSDLVAFEDVQITSLVKHHHLAKSISDASWGLFLGWVRYYGTRADVPVVAVSPRYTTQDCSGCGFRVKKTLSMRTHICPSCGLVLDRDENAALKILAAALVVAAALRTAGQVGTGSVSPEQVASGQTAPTRCVRKSTSQTGWMKEESPGASFGECQWSYFVRSMMSGNPLYRNSTRPSQIWFTTNCLLKGLELRLSPRTYSRLENPGGCARGDGAGCASAVPVGGFDAPSTWAGPQLSSCSLTLVLPP
jgi:IS605 OrfB family transposase